MKFDWTQGALAEGLRLYHAGEFFAAVVGPWASGALGETERIRDEDRAAFVAAAGELCDASTFVFRWPVPSHISIKKSIAAVANLGSQSRRWVLRPGVLMPALAAAVEALGG